MWEKSIFWKLFISFQTRVSHLFKKRIWIWLNPCAHSTMIMESPWTWMPSRPRCEHRHKGSREKSYPFVFVPGPQCIHTLKKLLSAILRIAPALHKFAPFCEAPLKKPTRPGTPVMFLGALDFRSRLKLLCMEPLASMKAANTWQQHLLASVAVACLQKYVCSCIPKLPRSRSMVNSTNVVDFSPKSESMRIRNPQSMDNPHWSSLLLFSRM